MPERQFEGFGTLHISGMSLMGSFKVTDLILDETVFDQPFLVLFPFRFLKEIFMEKIQVFLVARQVFETNAQVSKKAVFFLAKSFL